MILNKDLIAEKIGDEYILVPIGKLGNEFKGIIRINESAYFIVNQLKKDMSFDELVNAFLSEYKVDRETATKDISEIVESFKNINAIID